MATSKKNTMLQELKKALEIENTEITKCDAEIRLEESAKWKGNGTIASIHNMDNNSKIKEINAEKKERQARIIWMQKMLQKYDKK